MRSPRRTRARLLAAVISLCAVATRPGAATQEMTISLGDALSYYELGEMDAVSKALAGASGGDAEHFLPKFKKDAADWIAADGPDAVPRRRMVVAVFALEIGYASITTQFEMTRQVTEWACDLLRSAGRPTDAERKWMVAALSLIEATFEPGAHGVPPAPTVKAHLSHLQGRFPDDPHIALTNALLHEYDYWHSRIVVHGFGAIRSIVYDEDVAALAIPSLEGLLKRSGIASEVRREAELRLGYLEYVRDHVDAAMPHLTAAAEGDDDPTRVHLAHLFMGWLHQKAGRMLEATAEFYRAVASMNGQTASLALAVRLYAANERQEADAIVQAALEIDQSMLDPWKAYPYGDFRRFPLRLAELRQMIRP